MSRHQKNTGQGSTYDNKRLASQAARAAKHVAKQTAVSTAALLGSGLAIGSISYLASLTKDMTIYGISTIYAPYFFICSSILPEEIAEPMAVILLVTSLQQLSNFTLNKISQIKLANLVEKAQTMATTAALKHMIPAQPTTPTNGADVQAMLADFQRLFQAPAPHTTVAGQPRAQLPLPTTRVKNTAHTQPQSSTIPGTAAHLDQLLDETMKATESPKKQQEPADGSQAQLESLLDEAMGELDPSAAAPVDLDELLDKTLADFNASTGGVATGLGSSHTVFPAAAQRGNGNKPLSTLSASPTHRM